MNRRSIPAVASSSSSSSSSPNESWNDLQSIYSNKMHSASTPQPIYTTYHPSTTTGTATTLTQHHEHEQTDSETTSNNNYNSYTPTYRSRQPLKQRTDDDRGGGGGGDDDEKEDEKEEKKIDRADNRVFHACLLVTLIILVAMGIGGTIAVYKILDALIPMARNLNTMAQEGKQTLDFIRPQLPGWQSHIDKNLEWAQTFRSGIDVDQLQQQLLQMQHVLNTTEGMFTKHVEPNLLQWTKDIDHLLSISTQLKMQDVETVQRSLNQTSELLQYVLKHADTLPMEETLESFTKLVKMVQETHNSWNTNGGFKLNLALQQPTLLSTNTGADADAEEEQQQQQNEKKGSMDTDTASSSSTSQRLKRKTVRKSSRSNNNNNNNNKQGT